MSVFITDILAFWTQMCVQVWMFLWSCLICKSQILEHILDDVLVWCLEWPIFAKRTLLIWQEVIDWCHKLFRKVFKGQGWRLFSDFCRTIDVSATPDACYKCRLHAVLHWLQVSHPKNCICLCASQPYLMDDTIEPVWQEMLINRKKPTSTSFDISPRVHGSARITAFAL